MHPGAKETGSYGRWGLPALLRSLVQRRCIGRLDVANQGTSRSVWLDAGQIRAVASLLPGERLGTWLSSRGVLEQAEIERRLRQLPEGALCGPLLVSDGLLDIDRLQFELESRIVTLLSRMLSPAGTYVFHQGERFPFESVELTQSATSFLIAAARETDDLADLVELIRDDRFLHPPEDPGLTVNTVKLLSHEAFLLSRVDGTTTLATLRRLVPVSEEALVRGIAALWAAGLVEALEAPKDLSRKAATRSTTAPPSAPDQALATEFTPLQRKEREDILRLGTEIRLQSFYRRMNLETGAKTEQIQSAFAELARRYHPDRFQEGHLRFLRRELAEIFACIEEAAETLGSPERRRAYDTRLQDSRALTDDPFQEERHRDEARRQLVAASIRQAEELTRRGDPGGAVNLLEQAARYDPQPATLVALARLQLKNPMWSNRALDHLRHAVAVDPRHTEALLELARFWVRRGQPAQARECLEKLIAFEPTNREAQEMMQATRNSKPG
jgi:curved DNA-binding protein CbpA